MATGVSKTKWNASEPLPASSAAESGLAISLSYAGKTAESEILQTKPANLDLLWQGDEKTGGNKLCYGDNLPILASFLNASDVRGQVRLIYIDPPFATRSVFKTRSQMDAYADLLAGPQYLEFLRQRLILLRELLAEDGSIYVHLDDKMACYVKIIMDEVFGPDNFRNWITRKKSNPKNYTRKSYGNISDYLLFYTKSDSYVWNRPYRQWTPELARKEYIYVEEETGRRYKRVPLHAPGVRNGETGKPWRGMNPPPGKHWQFPPRVLDEMEARGEIYWSPNGNPRRKIYLDDSSGIPVQNIWLEFRDAHNQNVKITGYPTEKNPELLERLIETSSNPGDLVLDCFSGSGTTLAVASQLERRWIGIDNSPEAISTTLRRFRKGMERMGDFVSERKAAVEDQLTLPLFDQGITPFRPPGMISDFSLYVTETYSGELDNVLARWQEE